MKVVFIKDHPAGIKEGRVVDVSDVHAKRWIEEGYCKEKKAKVTKAKKPENTK